MADFSYASVNNNHHMSAANGGHYKYDRETDCLRRATCLDLPLIEICIWADPALYYNSPAFESTAIKMKKTVEKKIELCPDTGA